MEPPVVPQVKDGNQGVQTGLTTDPDETLEYGKGNTIGTSPSSPPAVEEQLVMENGAKSTTTTEQVIGEISYPEGSNEPN